MNNKKLILLLTMPAMLMFQNCRKEQANVIPAVTEQHEEHWNYEHPDTWGGISGDCDGVIQSPIDISTFGTLKSNLPDVQFSYTDFPIAIIDNGHTIQVNTKGNDAANTVVFNNKIFKLKQFHFHAHSEHTINGNHAPMELHMVHVTDNGEILVVGLMIQEGDANVTIDNIWNNLPATKEKEEQKTATINMSNVLPAGTGYYNYIGSLTTPPCTMGLQWVVMKAPLYLSAAQIQAFQNMYNHNYRPTQPHNNRVVYEKI